MLGYDKQTNPLLPAAYIRGIFNLTGIVFPVILIDGQVAGKWKREGNKLTLTPFHTLTPAEKAGVLDRVEALWPDFLKTIIWSSM